MISLISQITKRVIFSSFFFINFIQSAKSADFKQIYKSENNLITQLKVSKISDNKSSFKTSKMLSKNDFDIFLEDKKTRDSFLANNSENLRELVIDSDEQSEINNVIYAKGNVSVSFRGKLLKADNLIYDKLNKKVSAQGNITLILGDQIFSLTDLEYSFITEKGYLLNVKGYINTNTLIDDLSSNFSSTDLSKLESLFNFKKKEVISTPRKVENWLFLTDKITIDGEKWKSKKAIFSNDLLEFKQVKLAINSLEVYPSNEELRFKSKLNYLIVEETVSIPFWLGDRNFNSNDFQPDNRWEFGYDNLDKDGYFIGRKFNSIDISDDFILTLEPQFLIQRSLKGYTKSFVKKGDSITSEKVKRDTSFEDHFALKSQIKFRKNNWNLEINKNLNSFDFDKFSHAFRFKTTLSKDINFLNSKWNKSFYGVYRERVWNGSFGEAEIYSGYGSILKKENTWFVNDIKKTEFLSFSMANLTAEALETKNLLTNFKGNLFYSLSQKIPITVKDLENKSINNSYRYINEPISKGLSINTRLEVSSSFYENGNHREYLGLGIGPEFVFGNFKNKIFDYTRISLLPFYKFNGGESVFKFDQNYDKLNLNLIFDQQLFGPVIIKSIGTLNLTNDSDDYGKFINSKISLNWKKRSYEFGIFYQPHNQAGGISFELFGFK